MTPAGFARFSQPRPDQWLGSAASTARGQLCKPRPNHKACKPPRSLGRQPLTGNRRACRRERCGARRETPNALLAVVLRSFVCFTWHLRQTPLEKSKVAILRPTRYRASQNTWTGHGEPSPTSPDTHHPHISARFGLAQRPRRGGRVRRRLRHARAAMRRARTRRARAPAAGATDGRITFAS